MHSHASTTRQESSDSALLQRKPVLRVDESSDAYEREADRTADAVIKGTNSGPGWSLSRIRILPGLQRQEGPKTKSEEEKYKEAAKKVGEAFLETEIGKKLKDKVAQDPLVKGLKETGESFIATLPGKVITGAAAAGAVAALAAKHKELPAQIPEISLDKLTPGLKVKITYEGPVDNPTKAMITFSHTEQVSAKNKPTRTRAEQQREETARMALALERFRASLHYAPGTPEAKRQEEEQAAFQRAVLSGVGKIPGMDAIPTYPALARQPPSYQLQLPGIGFRPKPFSLLDEELHLKPLGEVGAAQEREEKKKREESPLQRKKTRGSGFGTAPPIVHDVVATPGQALDSATRRFMESRFGHDFSRVRVHTDSRAGQSAEAIDAAAYTVGNDLVFAGGQYSPQTPRGRHLLAHELAHVVQQRACAPTAGDGATLAIAADATLEQEADHAARGTVRGRLVSSGSLSAPGPVQQVQRTEHGTYVSTLGPKDYLDAGANFYRAWRYPNVRRVSNMGQVITDLDRARGSIDKFRIVSHGSSIGLELGLLPELSPDEFGAEAAEFAGEERFRKHFSAMKLVSENFFNRIYGALHGDAKTGPMLTALGAGGSAPAPTSPLGTVLRAVVDQRFLADVKLDTGGKANITHRAQLDAFVNLRLSLYRRIVVNRGANKRARKKLADSITGLIKNLPSAMASAGLWFAPLTKEEAKTLADPFIEKIGKTKRLRRELSRAVREGANGPYVRKLRSVKSKINSKTHIEIRGCNVGDDTKLLDTYRGYFGQPDNLPSISAPDLYQYFFRLGYHTYLRNAEDEANLEAAYDDASTGLAKSFEDLKRLQAQEMTRVINEKTIKELAAKYGLDTVKIRNLNPEIKDPNRLKRGQVVWLVKRKTVAAGFYKQLGNFCKNYLENEYAWPKVWAANPGIKDPQALKPTDTLKLPASVLTPPVASAPPTKQEFIATVQGGKAIMGFDTSQEKPILHMDNSSRKRSMAKWLAAQKFDPRGRTAAQLTRLYSRGFRKAVGRTYIQFLSHSYPNVVDPVFPEDPRYDKHIIKRP